MSLNGPSKPQAHQPSIRAFFQPRDQQYSAPPPSLPTQSPPPLPSPTSIHLPPTPSPVLLSTSLNGASKLQPPTNFSILPIEKQYIQPLRRINSLLLPINYPDAFYNAILASSQFSRIILCTYPETKAVGGIVCRLDQSLAPESTQRNLIPIAGSYDIYVQSLALLSPYREKGIASRALESVIAAAVEQKEYLVRELYAHVWTENIEGLEWYAARGFIRDEYVVEGYYHRLNPGTAWIVRRKITASDYLPVSAPEGETSRPQGIPRIESFQDRRPDMEWNDLPNEVLKSTSGLLRPGSEDVSAASSRSSSRSAGKKKRQYPAAAFGS